MFGKQVEAAPRWHHHWRIYDLDLDLKKLDFKSASMHKQRKCNCVWRLHQDGVTFDVFMTLTSQANATASDTKEEHCSVNVAKLHKQRRFIFEHNIDTRKEDKAELKKFS